MQSVPRLRRSALGQRRARGSRSASDVPDERPPGRVRSPGRSDDSELPLDIRPIGRGSPPANHDPRRQSLLIQRRCNPEEPHCAADANERLASSASTDAANLPSPPTPCTAFSTNISSGQVARGWRSFLRSTPRSRLSSEATAPRSGRRIASSRSLPSPPQERRHWALKPAPRR